MNFVLATAGVLGISASGPIMAATAAPALAIAFWRNCLGGIVMGVPAAVSRRGELKRMTRADRTWTAVAATALALHFACFITALQLTSVAAATALVCLQSAWIVVFNRVRGIRTAPAVAAGLGLALMGAMLISGFDLRLSPAAVTGDILALLGGALAGLYTMAGGRVRRTLSTQSYTGLCYGLCAVLLLVLCLGFGQPLVGFSTEAWLGILGVTLAAQLVGHTALNHLLAVISPLVVSMIILLEIPGAALLAALFLGETLPWVTYLGLALILAGLAVVVLFQNRGRDTGGSGAEAALGTD
ncbi:DMT family transporter [Arthrobacter sp. I2-34]|uniref:DMT family transporter n=1 Tax=Arthrobacter hankyongi TaxID=2904801 RepID=A0ABS9LAA0_9MICC|nr:DMT family transporter [Arthrobacter hankyongi]MCG2623611.1 DMT family transporter [Arthrobacter hankyongi]